MKASSWFSPRSKIVIFSQKHKRTVLLTSKLFHKALQRNAVILCSTSCAWDASPTVQICLKIWQSRSFDHILFKIDTEQVHRTCKKHQKSQLRGCWIPSVKAIQKSNFWRKLNCEFYLELTLRLWTAHQKKMEHSCSVLIFGNTSLQFCVPCFLSLKTQFLLSFCSSKQKKVETQQKFLLFSGELHFEQLLSFKLQNNSTTCTDVPQ